MLGREGGEDPPDEVGDASGRLRGRPHQAREPLVDVLAAALDQPVGLAEQHGAGGNGEGGFRVRPLEPQRRPGFDGEELGVPVVDE